MRDLAVVRRELAEKGIEYTPNELTKIIKELKKVQRRLLRNADFSDMTLWERQSVCHQAANQGMETSPDELDEIIVLASKIRAIEF